MSMTIDPNLSASIEVVTPQIAEKWLETNVHNRALKPVHLEALVNDLESGSWRFNGASIVFDRNGNLTDGQHRLIGVVRTGIAITSVVVRGVEPESQVTQDSGSKRTLGDQLKLAGYPNAALLASALRQRRQIERWINGLHGFEYSTSQGFADLAQLPNLPDMVSRSSAIGNTRPGNLNASNVAALWSIFADVAGQEDAEFFFTAYHAYNTGSELPVTTKSPIWQLREAVNKKRQSLPPGNSLQARWITAMTIKAWNLYRDDAEVGQLKWTAVGRTPEKYPTPR